MTDSRTSVREELLGLPDRRLMRHAIDSAREQVAAGRTSSAVLLVEICGLVGAGEEAAVSIAGLLAAELHEDDLVGRFGSDVLVVVARDIDDETDAHALAAHLADAIRRAVAGIGQSMTMGVAVVRPGDSSVASVIARADA